MRRSTVAAAAKDEVLLTNALYPSASQKKLAGGVVGRLPLGLGLGFAADPLDLLVLKAGAGAGTGGSG
jgi:hypothetical protein